MISLDTPRMFGIGPYIVDNFKVNYLYGLDDICKKYIQKNFTLLELGSNDGVSTSLFSSYCDRVVSVDLNKTQRMEKVLETHKNIEFHCMYFNEFKTKCNEKFDFIYIDGMHTYEDLKEDLLLSFSLIKDNGTISGHDFNSRTPGVIKAVYEFFDEKDIEVFSDSSWVININKLKK
jgi:hypothetical protein